MGAQEEVAAHEIGRLLQAIETLANPGCCRGHGKSTFQVIDRDGRLSDEEVTLCDGCSKELSRRDKQ